MAKYTKQDIINMVAEEDVEFIRMQFTDIEGNFKNVAITASQLEKVLSNNCMFDCSLVEGMLPTDNADMFLYPDLDTFTIFPWRPQQGKVARFICDVYRADRTPFEGDCRYILKKALQEAQALDIHLRLDQSVSFSCLMQMKMEDLQPTPMSRRVFWIWGRLTMEKMRGVILC